MGKLEATLMHYWTFFSPCMFLQPSSGCRQNESVRHVGMCQSVRAVLRVTMAQFLDVDVDNSVPAARYIRETHFEVVNVGCFWGWHRAIYTGHLMLGRTPSRLGMACLRAVF